MMQASSRPAWTVLLTFAAVLIPLLMRPALGQEPSQTEQKKPEGGDVPKFLGIHSAAPPLHLWIEPQLKPQGRLLNGICGTIAGAANS
jgi:hypothetical protein